MRRFRDEMRDIPTFTRFLTARTRTLAENAHGPTRLIPEVAPRRLLSRSFDRQMLAQLRAEAAAAQATVNDLLMASLFQTMQVWNDHRRVDRDGVLRILMPMNMRTRAELSMPAANHTSYAFIDKRAHEISNSKQLVKSIRAETSENRQTRMPNRVMSKIGMLNAIPYLLPIVLSPRLCHATAVLSNIGDPTRRFRSRPARHNGRLVSGNLVLQKFFGITPMRPLTRVAMFVNTYAGQLTISVSLDPTCFSPLDTSMFLDQFCEQLTAPLAQVLDRVAA